MIHGKDERQVEVAVIKSAIPSHANLMATHQSCHRPGVERFSEKLQIVLLPLFRFSPVREPGPDDPPGKVPLQNGKNSG